MDSTQELINASINYVLDWVDWLVYCAGRKSVWDGALCAACELGNLRLVKLFAEGLRITSDEVELIRQALFEASKSGNLDIVIWLKDRYSLTAADACKVLEECAYSLKAAECLIKAFDLTASDTREALKKACEFGKLLMVRYLLSRFDFPEDAIREARALVDGDNEIVDTLDGVLSGKPSY